MRLLALLFAAGMIYGQSGDWLITITTFGADQYQRAELTFDNGKITGKAGNITFDGTLQDGKVELNGKRPNGSDAGHLTGTYSNGEMKGAGITNLPVTWSAQRLKERPATPQTHHFTPTQFHNFFSGTIAPALTISPGDTVESWSVDAGGTDPQGKRRSPGGNPLTGPFYVEGALPGDTLVVRFTRLRLNRDTAGSGQRVTAPALNPFYFSQQKPEPNFDSNWTLDRANGVARLTKPTDKLKNYSVPLKAMLGCVGVAPPQKQSFRSGYLGSYGGNMDYNGLVEGTTVYLPVYQPGALLFIGDGHAAQGDGELTGDALETSTDWTFVVDVLPRKNLPNPRMESTEYWMASGIANSLPEALQAATTNLSQWLESEYKLSASEIGVVLGSGMRYDIAEVVDPQVHIVAKISKALLAQIQK
jgi:amidase